MTADFSKLRRQRHQMPDFVKVALEKPLNQMLDELETGGVYMKMKHSASAKR